MNKWFNQRGFQTHTFFLIVSDSWTTSIRANVNMQLHVSFSVNCFLYHHHTPVEAQGVEQCPVGRGQKGHLGRFRFHSGPPKANPVQDPSSENIKTHIRTCIIFSLSDSQEVHHMALDTKPRERHAHTQARSHAAGVRYTPWPYSSNTLPLKSHKNKYFSIQQQKHKYKINITRVMCSFNVSRCGQWNKTGFKNYLILFCVRNRKSVFHQQ